MFQGVCWNFIHQAPEAWDHPNVGFSLHGSGTNLTGGLTSRFGPFFFSGWGRFSLNEKPVGAVFGIAFSF